MKTIIFISLLLCMSCVYIVPQWLLPVMLEIAYIMVMIFFAVYWLVSGIKKIKQRRQYKQLVRYLWYNRMGLLESAYILEPNHVILYWIKLMNGASR